MTSTPACFAINSSTPSPDQHAARDRFLALVAEARAAVHAALASRSNDGADSINAPDDGPCEGSPNEPSAAGQEPSAAQRLERVVSELLNGGAVERAEVRVVG